MTKRRVVGAFVVALTIAGCGSSESGSSEEDAATDAVVMPDVVGEQLDVALSDIERGGIDDDVEVLGGGTFGVVDETNWTVCEQLPEAGQPVTEAPRLTVDRSCPDANSESEVAEPAPTEPVPTPSEPEPTQPESEPTQPEPASTEPPTSTQPVPVENITAENNAELAALLAGELGGECGTEIGDFAAAYSGRNIEFDGHISAMQNHDDYDTRYDFLLNTGDFSETTLAGIQNGPSFKFEDVNVFDLNLTGPVIPDSITTGDNLTITASVEEWNPDTCLFFLDPVATEVR